MTARVSVVVPYFNAEKYLAETVDSVRAQTFAEWELLLVNDGSTDGSEAIARTYAARDPKRIRLLSHPGGANRGVCASRNLAVREARGADVALLDADDVWLPEKLAQQVAILDAHPSVGMVYGHSEYWRSWSGSGDDHVPPLGVELDRVHEPPSLALLLYPLGTRTAPCPSDLLLRRELVLRIGGFEEAFHRELQLYEDQAFLSKVYLESPVYVSSARWDKYRIHAASCDVKVIGSGRYHEVRRYFLDWLERYYRAKGIRERRLREALRRALFPYRHRVLHAAAELWKLPPEERAARLSDVVRRMMTPGVGRVRLGSLGRTAPISRRFGFDRGLPVDRAYIERFLDRHKLAIRDRVLEVGDSAYTRRFGGDRVTKIDVLNVAAGGPETTIVADLAHADAIPSESFDCVIVTQTLQYVWDLAAAVRGLHRILAPGGVVLATMPGITPVVDVAFGDTWYWSFTRASARKLFADVFVGAVDVASEGNVLSSIGFLHGLAAEELPPAALAARDQSYPLLITVCARKPSRLTGDVARVAAASYPPLTDAAPARVERPRPGDFVAGELRIEGVVTAELGSGASIESGAADAPPGADGARAGRVDVHVVDGEAAAPLATSKPAPAEPDAPFVPLVSVVIPCFDHSHFLPEAIRSALGQTHPSVEVIVVDDGSTDDSFAVASTFAGVRVVRQTNQGLSAARNTGLKESHGAYLLFLDADDRLLPDAVAAGLRAARERPECAFVFGRFHVVNRAGARLLTSELPRLEGDAYAALLHRNQIVMHGAVLFRRETLEEVGPYDTRLRASEDYDMYLRVARRFPIAAYDAVVAEVRKHGSNMTQDMPRMLRNTLAALGKQRKHARGDAELARAYRRGVAFWKDWYGDRLATQLKVARFEQRWSRVVRGLPALVRYLPRGVAEVLWRARRSNVIEFVVSEEAAPAPASVPPDSDGPRLLRLGTCWTRPGQRFNVQPNGESALWVGCENASMRTRIVFGGVPLETGFGGPNLLTAFVPSELIEKPARVPVYLLE